LWDGADLGGRTILLHAEQGLGDTIQFMRYVPLVKERNAHVIVECPQSLVPLLTGFPGCDRLVANGTALPTFDVHSPLLSLPRILHTVLETIPAAIPYLSGVRCPVSGVRRWAGFDTGHRTPDTGLTVGIAWQGAPGFRNDRQRSIPLKQFAPLARVEGVRLVSLQKGPGTEQLSDNRQLATDNFHVAVLGEYIDETAGAFMETAAVMCRLDLVITSDTSIAHLAGALGVAVWVALPFVPDWRWLLDRPDSPWYPTMRLFRQKRYGDWPGVFENMAQELGRVVAMKG
jgi:hypothetical protein